MSRALLIGLALHLAAANLVVIGLIVSAGYDLWRQAMISRAPDGLVGRRGRMPTAAVLVPAHCEETMIAETVSSALALNYPALQVVVVNDGSTDATLDRLIERFELMPTIGQCGDRLPTAPVRAVYGSELHPNLIVIDKKNGGKADALNAAIDHADADLVCTIDADTIVDPDGLHRLAAPFVADNRIIATGGTVQVVNGCTVELGRVSRRRLPDGFLPGVQFVEYTRSFLLGRLGLNRLGGNVIISGAFGLFNRQAVIDAGGFACDTVGEDMELVLRLRRRAYEQRQAHEVRFIPDSVAWTEAPVGWGHLSAQRGRWHRGLFEALWRHRRLIGNRRYGPMGLFILPYYLLVELLGPAVELAALFVLVGRLTTGRLSLADLVIVGTAWIGLAFAASLLAVELYARTVDVRFTPAERWRMVVLALAEQLGYRHILSVVRLRSVLDLARGDKRWGRTDRSGFRSGVPVAGAVDAGRSGLRRFRTAAKGGVSVTDFHEKVT